MKPIDEAILRLLSPPNALMLTPANIAVNIGYTNEYTGERCRKLRDLELLTVDENGYYSLTDFGTDVWNGEISIDELEELNADE